LIKLREIPLEFEPELIEDVVITGLWFEQQHQARTLIEQAQAEADRLVQEAQQEAEDIMNNARTEAQQKLAEVLTELETNFLDKSEGLFAEWYARREQDDQELVNRARNLVEAVFMAMLDQLPDEDKLSAVFRQIHRAGDKQTEATLYFHTRHKKELQEWLSRYHLDMWKLITDDELPPNQLILATSKGELSLSWDGFRKHLVSRLM